MKKVHSLFLLFMAAFLAVPLFNSCKEGDEDPWFSFYTRTQRLSNDWKVVSYRRSEQTNDSLVGYTFDGSTYIKVKSNYSYSSPGTWTISFRDDGSYEWIQTIATDTSNYQYNEKGLWYFTGGNDVNDYSSGELLALQKTEMTETFSSNGYISTLTYAGSGDLETNVYHILKLASDEVKLESELTTNYSDANHSRVTVVTTEITLQPQ
jgi:hypothetical protein